MYRHYEDARALENQLKELKEEFKRERDFERKVELYDDIQDLKERINHAWRDEEE